MASSHSGEQVHLVDSLLPWIACATLRWMANAAGESSLAEAAMPRSGTLASLCIVIPAWQPTPLLLPLIADLVQRGFGSVVVIDDGSPRSCAAIFADLARLPGVVVLRHASNLGKGRALKTGFGHLVGAVPGTAPETNPKFAGVVTADADGQHTPDDIERVARALLREPTRPVLGSRGFENNVPLRSKLGNLLTRQIFRSLSGVRLSDTQTGLRGLPVALLPEMLPLRGERYEYEMTMLAHLCRAGHRPIEIPIATVYLENNRGSHFKPVRDSVRVYFVLLRFYASTLLKAKGRVMNTAKKFFSG